MNSEHIPNGQVSDAQQAFADRDWWQKAGSVLDLTLNGWSYRNEARFTSPEGITVMLPGPVAERLIALTRRSSAGVKGGWQPIETAPKDNTFVLVRLSNGEVFRAFRTEHGYHAASDIGFVNAKYWMPDPATLSSPSHIGEDEPVAFDPHRVLKDTLFQFVKAGYYNPASYGGVLVADGKYARIRFDAERPSPSVPPQGETSEVIAQHDPKLNCDLKRIKAKLESLPEALRGPFVVSGLAPYAALTPSPTLEPTDAEVELKRGNFVAFTSDEPQLSNFHTAIYEDGYDGLLIALCNQNGRYPWQAAAILKGLNSKSDEIAALIAEKGGRAS